MFFTMLVISGAQVIQTTMLHKALWVLLWRLVSSVGCIIFAVKVQAFIHEVQGVWYKCLNNYTDNVLV